MTDISYLDAEFRCINPLILGFHFLPNFSSQSQCYLGNFIMGTGTSYTDLVDPSRKWYNKRCVPSTWDIILRLWNVHLFKASLFSTSGFCFCKYLTSILYPCQFKASHNNFFRLMTSFVNSYDGNIINSFQTLPQWMRYFHKSAGTGSTLFNSMQVSIFIKFNVRFF